MAEITYHVEMAMCKPDKDLIHFLMITQEIISDKRKVQRNYSKNTIALAKEALSSGDKTLSENYFQHADHFMRIIEDKNKNQNQNKEQIISELVTNDKDLVKNKDVNQDKSIEEKKE